MKGTLVRESTQMEELGEGEAVVVMRLLCGGEQTEDGEEEIKGSEDKRERRGWVYRVKGRRAVKITNGRVKGKRRSVKENR